MNRIRTALMLFAADGPRRALRRTGFGSVRRAHHRRRPRHDRCADARRHRHRPQPGHRGRAHRDHRGRRCFHRGRAGRRHLHGVRRAQGIRQGHPEGSARRLRLPRRRRLHAGGEARGGDHGHRNPRRGRASARTRRRPSTTSTPTTIQSIGSTETGKILQLLEPSFNFSTTTISDGTDIIRPATLRALGPDQDARAGQRQAPSPAVARPLQQTVGRGLGRLRHQRHSRGSPSTTSRCCATAPPPSTARTPSPASST